MHGGSENLGCNDLRNANAVLASITQDLAAGSCKARSMDFETIQGENREPDVQKNPDRQSRRDRLSGDPHREENGHRDRRGLFGCRRAQPACRAGRRGGPYRPGTGGGELSSRRQDHRRVQGNRRRCGPSRLRFPVRARELRQGARRGEASPLSARRRTPSRRWATRSNRRNSRSKPASASFPAMSARSTIPNTPSKSRARSAIR